MSCGFILYEICSRSCVFCKRPSHFQGLGDLFGPYFVSSEGARAAVSAASHSALGEKAAQVAKFILGGDGKMKGKKRKPSSTENSPTKAGESVTAEVMLSVLLRLSEHGDRTGSLCCFRSGFTRIAYAGCLMSRS